MKLNGKYYLIKKIFSYLIDDLILDVELSNTNDTSVDLEDLNSNDIDNVIDLLLRLKNQIFAMYDKEKYLSVNKLCDEIKSTMYDKNKVDVAMYRRGAYGVKSKASELSVKRFAFNVCAKCLIESIEKYNNV